MTKDQNYPKKQKVLKGRRPHCEIATYVSYLQNAVPQYTDNKCFIGEKWIFQRKRSRGVQSITVGKAWAAIASPAIRKQSDHVSSTCRKLRESTGSVELI